MPGAKYLASTAALSGLVGSCVRSWMIDIPNAQIRATMAVGYKKITLGHMKIRIPGPRCAPAGAGVEDEGADFASVDMTGKLRAERSSQVLADCTGHRHTQSVCQIAGRGHPNALAIVGKVPEALEIGQNAGRLTRRAAAALTTKMFAAAAQTLRMQPRSRKDRRHARLDRPPQPLLK